MTIDELRKKISSPSAFEVAQKTGLHPQTIHNFRTGKGVHKSTLKKLEEYAAKWIK